jgi:hypothetical protein
MNIFGLLTMIFATIMALVAFPIQIRKHYLDKKVGLHWSLIVLSFLIYFFRAMFALTADAGIIWFIFVSDAIGSIASAIIIWQLFYYHKKKVP